MSKPYSILIVALIFLTGGAMIVKKCGAQKEKKQVTQIAQIKKDSTEHYRDLWNTEHAKRLVIQGDAKTLNVFYADKFDSICKRLRIKEKQLKDISEVVAQSKGTFVTPLQSYTVTPTDTPTGLPIGWTGKTFNWQDSFLHETGFIDSSNIYVTYSMNLPITITNYWKRRWFLGKKRYYIDGYSDNPNVTIQGLTGIKIN